MARKLTDETKEAIKADKQLMIDYCHFIGVSVFSLLTFFYRDSKVLTHHDAVKFLASRLNKTPDEILTENSEAGTKVMA
jgi:hypothetical protein